MNKDYADFLASKELRARPVGFEKRNALPVHLFPFQRHCVEFALRVGRSGCFLDTGLGKTEIQLEWCQSVIDEVGGRALILTPLAVAGQTKRRADKYGYDARVIRCMDDAGDGINIINYDRLDKLDFSAFSAVSLDEASILKSFTGKTTRALISAFSETRFKLVATATPAPNDHMELGNYSEFLNIMATNEMLSRFFINDASTASQQWRLKRHGVDAFWNWVASWARMAERPSDLGDSNDGFILPPFRVIRHKSRDSKIDTALLDMFGQANLSATNMHDIKRQTSAARADAVAEIIASEPDETWLVWCDTDYEADALKRTLPHAIEVRGSQTVNQKEQLLEAFGTGNERILIAKPAMCGFGLDWSHCARMAFVGRSYSYETWYQAVRRCWRFGQRREVNVHLVVAESETNIGRVIDRKAADHDAMKQAMRKSMSRVIKDETKTSIPYDPKHRSADGLVCMNDISGRAFRAIHGDCVHVMQQMPDECIDFSVYSPPFGSLFVYSGSAADMGNSTDEEFAEHYRFMVREKFRLTKPGRLTAVHCSDLPMTKWRDGAVGIKDFSGQIIAIHEEAGWILHGRRTIWKCPVTEMTRTKHVGLLYKQLQKDSSKSRGGLPDYLLTFIKPGENTEPIKHTPDNFPLSQWQEWASPIWMTVNQTNVLNVSAARSKEDERHICPLQLDVIDRALILWSNVGDTVLSPFMGIGSEGVRSLLLQRSFIGIELKEEYWKQAVRNFKHEEAQDDLFREVF